MTSEFGWDPVYPEWYDRMMEVNETSSFYFTGLLYKKEKIGAKGDSNPRPLAPKARIIPLDHWPMLCLPYAAVMAPIV